jgi:hypothetical protein
VRGLLGEAGEADAKEAPIWLTLSRFLTDLWQLQQIGAEPHALRVIACVIPHARDRRLRHL